MLRCGLRLITRQFRRYWGANGNQQRPEVQFYQANNIRSIKPTESLTSHATAVQTPRCKIAITDPFHLPTTPLCHYAIPSVSLRGSHAHFSHERYLLGSTVLQFRRHHGLVPHNVVRSVQDRRRHQTSRDRSSSKLISRSTNIWLYNTIARFLSL